MTPLADRTVLLTGASSGIGLEAAVKLARLGAQVVMVARDPAKGEAAVAAVRTRSASHAVSLLLCDFASQAAIRRLASDYRARFARLDILVNNAGSVSAKRETTVDGLEQTFAVNHLGYVLLTRLLLDLLEKSAPARIVNVTSIGHCHGDMDFDNLQFEKGGYRIMQAYCRSKLGNVLFTAELARRLAGTGVTANCVHPGIVATQIWSRAPWFARPIIAARKLFMLTPEQGGDTLVYLATSPELEGQSGGYYEDNRRVQPGRLAQDQELAKRLWDVSAKLVKLA